MKQQSDETTAASIAATVRRVAVLVDAGVPHRSVWRYVASAELTSSLQGHVERGTAPADALLTALGDSTVADEWAWRSLAACLLVAARVGGPLADSLRHLATAITAVAQVRRDSRVALAAPQATARLVLALPPLGAIGSTLLGFDTLRVLVATSPGWVILALGCTLLLAARSWSRRLVAAAQPPSVVPGLQLELMAIAVHGGASLGRARDAVDAALARCGLRADDDAAMREVLELSRRAGVPAAELLRSAATEARMDAFARSQRAATELTVSLLLPIGVCVLPAFVLLCVAPLVLAIVSSTTLGL